MIGKTVCLAIPYKTFKEKTRITRKYEKYGKYNIKIYEKFILITINNLEGNRKRKRNGKKKGNRDFKARENNS